MILENPFHRRKVKAIIQENTRLKEEIRQIYTEGLAEKLSGCFTVIANKSKEIEFLKNKVKRLLVKDEIDFDGIIEEQAGEIKNLKKQIQGYKMLIAKFKKKELNK